MFQESQIAMNPTYKNTINTNKVTQALAKGCGCFSFLFLIFFLWGIWTTITTYVSIKEVNAIVIESIQTEKTDLSARPFHVYTPLVSYQYNGTNYQDTLFYKEDFLNEFEIGSSIKTYIHPENPQKAMDNATGTFYFYTVFLVLAFLAFIIHKLLKKDI